MAKQNKSTSKKSSNPKLKSETPKAPEVAPVHEVEFSDDFFYIEKPEFYQELEKNVKIDDNVDDFLFKQSIANPGKVRVRKMPVDFDAKNTSSDKRPSVSGKPGDFLIIDASGNKLAVKSKLFRSIYSQTVK